MTFYFSPIANNFIIYIFLTIPTGKVLIDLTKITAGIFPMQMGFGLSHHTSLSLLKRAVIVEF